MDRAAEGNRDASSPCPRGGVGMCQGSSCPAERAEPCLGNPREHHGFSLPKFWKMGNGFESICELQRLFREGEGWGGKVGQSSEEAYRDCLQHRLLNDPPPNPRLEKAKEKITHNVSEDKGQ